MKKLVRSRAGALASAPAISIRVSAIAMSKWAASSKTPAHPDTGRRLRLGLRRGAGLLPSWAPHPADLPFPPVPRPQGREEGIRLDGVPRPADRRPPPAARREHRAGLGQREPPPQDRATRLHRHPAVAARVPAPVLSPDLNPVEGIWSVLKRGPLANVAFAGFAHLLEAVKGGLREIQHQPAIIDGCFTGTGLTLEPDAPTS